MKLEWRMASTHVLSKSSFVRGLQCEKAAWLYKNRIDLMDPTPEARQAIFDRGVDVGRCARDLFPGGIDLSPEFVDGVPRFAGAIARTSDAVRGCVPVIYEAAFVHDGVLAAIDILVREGSRWRAYEVKSGTSVKDTYAQDAALQYWVLAGAGLDLEDISIVHIDTTYVREGAIDVKKLFATGSVLDHAEERREEIGGHVARLKDVITRKQMPEIPVGPRCRAPYTCAFHGHCWEGFPEHSVFDLSRVGAAAWDLFDRGIRRAADIPDEEPLRWNQRIEVRCARTLETYIERDAVRAFVETTDGPLCFLDFETCGPAVPLYDGTRPYQAIPFQYSLHRRRGRGAPLEHKAFLGDGRTDPRAALVEQLLGDTPGEDRIVVYSGYERRVLTELGDAFPKRAAEIGKRIARLLDLSVPFRNHAYYTVAMDGSYSIKRVLPALVPDLSYHGMAIGDGGAASAAYESLHTETDQGRIALIRRALLDYCGLDTLAMVRLLEVLERV
jgi:hypothetical protein